MPFYLQVERLSKSYALRRMLTNLFTVEIDMNL